MIFIFFQVTMCQLYIYSCYDNFVIIGPPPAPSNLTVAILNKEDSTLTVNLTWSQENSRYVVVYYVEVTATNITSITNTTSQYIVLPLQIGVMYSFRVRGADSINRLGEWSDSYHFPSKPLIKIMHSSKLPLMQVMQLQIC